LLGLWNAHGSRKPFEPDPAKINIFIWGNLKGETSMKQIKRIMAFALALVLALAMSITVFAEDTATTNGLKQPTSEDKATITVKNVEAGATVTAYKYVEAVYSKDTNTKTDLGLEKYQVVSGLESLGLSKDVIEEPSSTDIFALSDAVAAGTLTAYTKATFTATATSTEGISDYKTEQTVEAGSYLILVTNTSSKIYNPMIVSVYYDSTDPAASGTNNSLGDGTVDATLDASELKDGVVYAKSSEPTVTKTVSDSDVAIGDTVTFTITTAVPKYSDDYNNDKFTYTLTDELAAGFDFTEGTFTAVAGKDNADLTTGTDAVEMREDNGKYVIDLSKAALAHRGETITITYQATLNNNAVTDAVNKNLNDGNTNKVTLTYSSEPNTGKTLEDSDTTHTYTFDLDKASDGTTNIITKKAEDGSLLTGAEFTLKDKDGNVAGTETSAADGSVSFKGLDAGTYTLQETKAPKGYSLNNTVYTVVIDPQYESGIGSVIKSLSIKISYTDANGNEFTDQQSVEITDTSLASLPSTGGIGTTIFTIAGCLIMIAAAGMYFASRRKSAK
jgi:fimbrial isopeptide formation D2 family protein/LPXTG-motif cell wall-anchored protein